MSDETKMSIWSQLPQRVAPLGRRTFRFPHDADAILRFAFLSLNGISGRWCLGPPWFEGRFETGPDKDIRVDASELEIIGESQDARLALKWHDRCRLFGFSGEKSDGVMRAVALLLPKGRANIQDNTAVGTGGSLGVHLLDIGATYTHVTSKGLKMPAGRAAADKPLGALPDWFQNVETVDCGIRLETAITSMDVRRTYALSVDSNVKRDELPAEVRCGIEIPSAFACCAYFEADNPGELSEVLNFALAGTEPRPASDGA